MKRQVFIFQNNKEVKALSNKTKLFNFLRDRSHNIYCVHININGMNLFVYTQSSFNKMVREYKGGQFIVRDADNLYNGSFWALDIE